MEKYQPGDIVESVLGISRHCWVAIVGKHSTNTKMIPLIAWRYDTSTKWHIHDNGGTDECRRVTDPQRCEEVWADYTRAVLTGDVNDNNTVKDE